MPLVSGSTPPPALEPSIARPSFARRLRDTAIRLAFVLALGAIAGGGWYLAKKGFGRQWRALVVEELHKRGVEASVRRLTLDPFRGLVAQDVTVFDYKNRDNVLAEISRLSLDVNYAALLQHQPFLNAIDVRNARVTLPLPVGADPKSPRAQIRNLHAHVYFPPEQIYLSQAEGIFCGIHVSASGQLIRRKDYRASRRLTEEEWQERLQLVQRIVAEIARFKFTAHPELQVKFSGDLAAIEKARVEGTFRAEQLQCGNYALRKVALAGDFTDETLLLSQCEWQDDQGRFNASALWRRPADDLEFEARSSLNLPAFAKAFGLWSGISDFEFATPPRFNLSGRAHLGEGSPRWQVIGHVAADGFSYRKIPFLEGAAEFSWDGERTLIRDIRIRHQSGHFNAQLLDAPNDFRLDLTSTINANALRSLTPPRLRDFVNDWEWPRSSSLQLTIRGTNRDPAGWRGDGKLQLDRGRFRTIGFNSASADVHFGGGAVTYENFRVVRDEGVATGTCVYDFARQETRVSNVRSTLHPSDAFYWIDPELARLVQPYKFARPPIVTAAGVYRFHGGRGTHLEIGVDSAGPMEYVFLGKTLPFNRVNARLLFTDDRLQIMSLNGDLFSGQVEGTADISLVKNQERYRSSITLEGIDFPRLTDLYFNYKTAHGSMNGRFDWSGTGSDARSIDGKGTVEVRNGDVFSIPLFGPLSDLLEKVVPGVGYRVARKASMSFVAKDALITTSDFRVDAGGFGMVGHGNAHFLDDQLDFEVRIDASGAAFVLTPLYRFFEYKAEGSLSHPTWRPKNF